MVWLMKYYPVRIKNVGEQQKADRQTIWDFKDGRAYEQVALMTARHLQNFSAVGSQASCSPAYLHQRKRKTNCATSVFRKGCANSPMPSTAFPICKCRLVGWQSMNTERMKPRHGRYKWQTMTLISSRERMCCSLTTSSPKAYPTPPQPRIWKRVGQTCWAVYSWQRHSTR